MKSAKVYVSNQILILHFVSDCTIDESVIFVAYFLSQLIETLICHKSWLQVSIKYYVAIIKGSL